MSRSFPTQADQQRKHREGTSKAMKSMMTPRPSCGRKQNPRRIFEPGLDPKPFWVCRYCGTEVSGGRAR